MRVKSIEDNNMETLGASELFIHTFKTQTRTATERNIKALTDLIKSFQQIYHSLQYVLYVPQGLLYHKVNSFYHHPTFQNGADSQLLEILVTVIPPCESHQVKPFPINSRIFSLSFCPCMCVCICDLKLFQQIKCDSYVLLLAGACAQWLINN